ncbi:MAG: hypothetical protein ACK56I_36070, partial [bacterium]
VLADPVEFGTTAFVESHKGRTVRFHQIQTPLRNLLRFRRTPADHHQQFVLEDAGGRTDTEKVLDHPVAFIEVDLPEFLAVRQGHARQRPSHTVGIDPILVDDRRTPRAIV